MATRAEIIASLKTRRDAVVAEIVALDSTKAGGLPNASGAGENVDHQGYKKGLYDELDALEKRIAKMDVGFVSSIER